MLKRTETVKGEPEGIGDLVHRLVEDAKAYARAEVGYLKAIGTEKANALKAPVILGLLAILFAHAAFLVLIATIFVGLASLMSDALAGVVTLVICLAAAGGLGYLAYAKATKGLEDAK
ncbi:phage holin family protein [Sphingomonas humi]|uniref:Phage holin family protein n=1 Tax=Sphingomonas humi TaxID=335630 RepID=A0ABP7S6R8_9SPHN